MSNKINICKSNDGACGGDGSDKSGCFPSKSEKNEITFPATATLNNSIHFYPTALRRKIRKTSRRKWKCRCNGCLHNNAVNITKKATKATRTPLAVLASAPIATRSHKCKICVNNSGAIHLKSSTNKHKKGNLHNQREYFCQRTCSCRIKCSCISHTTCSSVCCDTICCRNCCTCSCISKKISIIVRNIVTMLLPQTTTKLAHQTTVTSTDKKYFANNDKRKKFQLHLKHEKLLLKNVCAVGKCVTKTKTQKQQEQQQQQKTKNFITNISANSVVSPAPETQTLITAATVTATPVTTTQTSAVSASVSASASPPLSSSFLSSTLPATKSSNNTFSTLLPKCKESTSTTTYLNEFYTRSKPPAAPSCSTWYSPITCPAPTRILNELYGVIFMALLVLSICHNNVLETSAASVRISKGDVGTSSLAAEKNIIFNEIEATTVRLSDRQYNRQHPPERLEQQHQQHLPQTNINSNSKSKRKINKNNSNHHQLQIYLNDDEKEVEQQRALKNKMEEDESNHILQPQNQHEAWPTYEQHEQYLKQQQLTTEASSFSRGMALETAYNNTFQSLSIIDGDLTVAIDTSENLMTVEEEMLVAASGGAVGVGSSANSLSNHLHNSNNGLQFYNSAVMGLDGFDVMADNSKKHTMPIFDFGMPRNITARTGHTEAIIKCRVDRLDDKSVSWIRKRDLHILTVGTATYTSDKRFQVTESKDSREWTLHVKSPQARDSGIYECQVNTEPKMSMAFQLNVIEISPDAKAVITGPADLHFKVGSAIILTCIVHQPSVKDIGPIYWYRGEYMITPFDINENTHEASTSPERGIQATHSQAAQNPANILEQNHYYPSSGIYDGPSVIGGPVGVDGEQIPQILSNEITQDFSQRIAMESQLGDTMKSRLRISNAQTSDTGNYTCQPTTASSASVMVHVINDENPAAMQKSAANTFHCTLKGAILTILSAVIMIIFTAVPASIFERICTMKEKGYANDVGYCCLSAATIKTTIKLALRDNSCMMLLTCMRLHLISNNMLEAVIHLMRQQQQVVLQNNLPPRKILKHTQART